MRTRVFFQLFRQRLWIVEETQIYISTHIPNRTRKARKLYEHTSHKQNIYKGIEFVLNIRKINANQRRTSIKFKKQKLKDKLIGA